MLSYSNMPIIKQISIYAESHLPKKGWFQGCIMCEVITSKTQLYTTFKKTPTLMYEIHTYICPKCIRDNSKTTVKAKYHTVCKNMINELDL